MMEPDQRTLALLEPSVRFLLDPNNCLRRKAVLIQRLGYEKGEEIWNSKNKCNSIQSKVQWETEEVESYRCVCQTLDKNVPMYLSMYENYKKGVMPFSGGYLDQPAIIISILNRIHSVINEMQAEEEKKQQMKQRRK